MFEVLTLFFHFFTYNNFWVCYFIHSQLTAVFTAAGSSRFAGFHRVFSAGGGFLLFTNRPFDGSGVLTLS